MTIGAQSPLSVSSGNVSDTGAFTSPVVNGVYNVPAGGDIQAAITAVGAGGKVVLTPSQTYTITTTIEIVNPYVELDCQGAVLKSMVTTGYLLETSGSPAYIQNGDRIKNCIIEPGVQSAYGAIHDGSWHVTFDNIAWLANGSNYFTGSLYQIDSDEGFTITRGKAPQNVCVVIPPPPVDLVCTS